MKINLRKSLSPQSSILKNLLLGVMYYTPIFIGVAVLVFNDWRFGELSFSDPLIIIGIAMLIGSIGKLTINQFFLIIAAILLTVINIIVAPFFNSDYAVQDGIFYIGKILAYTLFVLLLYNHIIRKQLQKQALNILIGSALIIGLIGVYITVVISMNLNLPYEMFWEFTRQDPDSYMFQGHADVTRTRSIMSEPQHLGLFLNAVLVLALFSGRMNKKYILPLIVIGLIAISTLSFSTIPVTILIVLIYLIKKHGVTFFLRKEFLLIILVAFIVAIPMWSSIETTLFSRGEQISGGEDESASLRLSASWGYVEAETFITGGGVGSTPYIWNNYAYMLTDYGIVGLGLMIILSYIIFKRNPIFGLFFVIFSFQKGGYLTGFYWMIVLFFFIFSYVAANKAKITKIRRIEK